MGPRFYLKKPNGKQKTFSLYKQRVLDDGKTRNEFIKEKDLTALNVQIKLNRVKPDEALKIAERIRSRYNVDIGAESVPESLNQTNMQVLDRYWNKKYRHRLLRDQAAARSKLECAIRALGDVDISTAPEEDIAGKIMDGEKPVNVKRTYLQKLNQILKYLQRDITLLLPPEDIEQPHFLTPKEFNKLLSFITNERTKIIAQVAYYTGARAGEIMWLDAARLVSNKEVSIEKQYCAKTKKFIKTKNRKPRRAYVFTGGVDALKEWSKVKDLSVNMGSESNRIRRACMKAFPGNTEKHCSIHDLRHSYAGNVVALTGSLTWASQYIGDSLTVTERYYAGFIARTESIETVDRLVRENTLG